MPKILTTIGPITASKKEYLDYCIKKSGIIRFNMSHNDINWHKKKIDYIKKIDSKKLVLTDIPGAKPRTLNNKILNIKKGQELIFGYKPKNIKKIIPISNPLPKVIKKKLKFFSISDGIYLFKFINFKNGLIKGKSMQSFSLYPKKGLNIPYSIYDDKFQSKIYSNFLKKISRIKNDCIGLSFIQNSSVVKNLKKKISK